LTVAVLPDDG